jgi:NDP-sugar pyrophosphorylase family protein
VTLPRPSNRSPSARSLTAELFDLSTFEHRGLFQDLEQPWLAIQHLPDFLASCAVNRIAGQVHPSAVIEGPVFVGPGTVIKAGAIICGPAIIGANCLIGDALLRNCLLGDHCVVGHASEVTASILLPHSVAPHFNYVGHTILGNRAHIAGGVLCANVRLDNTPVTVRVGAGRISTGMTKLGALIGDDCQLGAACVLMPGTILGRGCVVYPGAHVRGWHEPGTRIKVRLVQECPAC